MGPQMDPSSLTVCSYVAPQVGPSSVILRNRDTVSPFPAHAVSVTSDEADTVLGLTSLADRGH